MAPGHVCAVKHCLNKRDKTNAIFFCFPKEPERARVWAMAAGREDLLEKIDTLCISHRICEIHFEKRCFTNAINNRLMPSATPTIFPSLEGPSSDHTYSVVGIRQRTSGVQDDDSMEKRNPRAKIVVLENIMVTPEKPSTSKPLSIANGFEELSSCLSDENESASNALRSPSPTTENSQTTDTLECFSPTSLAQTSAALLSDDASKIELENNLRLLIKKNLQLEKQLKEYECRLQKTKEQVMQDMTLDDYMTLTYKFCGNNMELAYFINVQVSQMEEG